MELTAGEKFSRGKDLKRYIPGRCTITITIYNRGVATQPLRKGTAGYKLSGSQEKINHLMYMDDIKLFAKNEKELETFIRAERISSQDIRMEFGIEQCSMLIRKSGKQDMTEGIELPNKEKNPNAQRKGNLQILANI